MTPVVSLIVGVVVVLLITAFTGSTGLGMSANSRAWTPCS